MPLEHPAEEITRLQRCIGDLASVLSLPAIWKGGNPHSIAGTLLDALTNLLRLNFAYVRLNDAAQATPIESVRVSPNQAEARELIGVLHTWQAEHRRVWPANERLKIGDRDVCVVRLDLGLDAEVGTLVAGSERPHFPAQTDTLVLSVAANQAAIAIKEAWLIDEQKRFANELERRVVQRTAELAAANGELRTEIAERKHAEHRLRESELNLRQLTETIPEMLWSATATGSIDYCNARLLEYTGVEPAEVMGNGWTKLLHPDDADKAVDAWRLSVSTGAPYQLEVRAFHAADRTYRWCVTSARALLDSQRTILKWHGTVVDMHDWRQAQEALRTTQAELAHASRVMTLGVLTASIAHEVNQPLASIVTNASTCLRMLAADPPNIEGARKIAERNIRDGNRAADVVARLRRLFAKNAAKLEPVDLNEVAREVIALSSNELQKRRVQLRTEFSEPPPLVTGDRVQLQQVILNLILNASEAMSEVEGRARDLEIRTDVDEKDFVHLTVTDSGVGIEPGVMAKLFEPFHTTKRRGMGIGLFVSRSIIESLQGHIAAAGNEGHGATISFSLPRTPDEERHVPG